MMPSFTERTFTDTKRVRECPAVSPRQYWSWDGGTADGQVRSSSARPALAPWTKARISSDSRMRAGLSGSVDWRRATRPPGSFLASRQEPPLSLQGLRQPSAPRLAAGMPLRICSLCMSGLLDDLAQDGHGVLGGGGLGAHAVERLGVAGRLVGLVQVVGA